MPQAPVATTVVDGNLEAALSTSTLAPGQHEIAASYSGNLDFNGNNSNVVTLVVNSPPPSDGPQITLLQRYGYHMMPTSLVLTFDQALEQATAENPHNYQITGPRGRAIRVTSAVYDPTTDTVTLRPSERINIHYKYELTVDGKKTGGLTDTQGLLLDGTDSGKPGSNYKAPVTWRNLVLSPPNATALKKSKTPTKAAHTKSNLAPAARHSAKLFARPASVRR